MNKKNILFSLCIGTFTFLNAQTYVGEIQFLNRFEYVKLSCKDGVCEFSVPYVDGDKKFPVSGNPIDVINTRWEVDRGIEDWKFTTELKDNKIRGKLYTTSGIQNITLTEQLEGISKNILNHYNGVYQDEDGLNLIIYDRFDFLHIISPYSEETMSLKPIGENRFWSISGEKSTFKDFSKNTYNTIEVTNRKGLKKILKRTLGYKVQEKWIPIKKDTLYAKLYMPISDKKVPACLVLPGGGATGIDNYEFEAMLFAANGMASLVFDKSGNGKSKGPGNFQLQSFEEKNIQYIQLFNYLKKHPQVNSNKVGVHGPSEGGRLSLLMAIDLKDQISFVNAIAAPLMTMKEGQFYAMDQHHRLLGISEIENMDIQGIWSIYYQGIIDGKIDEDIIGQISNYSKKNNRLFLPPPSTVIPSSPTKEDLLNERVVNEANQITCPVFLQYGENDQRVNATKSLMNFYPRITNKDLIQTKFYPRASHSLMTPEFKISPGYLQDKIKWLKKIHIL